MMLTLREVSGSDYADSIRAWNRLDASFPALQDRHLEKGFWWFAYDDLGAIGFAGMVPFEPFPGVGYLKRAYVMPAHRGNGLQVLLLRKRETKARALGWTHLVSECGPGNIYSARNFERAGFERIEPEQPWGEPGSLFWRKALSTQR